MSHENEFDPAVWTVTGEESEILTKPEAARLTERARDEFMEAAYERDDGTVPLWQTDPTTKVPIVRVYPEHSSPVTVFSDNLDEEDLSKDPCSVELPGAKPNIVISVGRFLIAAIIVMLIVVAVLMAFVSYFYGLITRGLLWIVDELLGGS